MTRCALAAATPDAAGGDDNRLRGPSANAGDNELASVVAAISSEQRAKKKREQVKKR